MRRLLLIISATLVLLIPCFPQDNLTPGSIRGEVVTAALDGEPAFAPHARVVLRGPMKKETESEAQGAFLADGLPPGMCDIEASAPRLKGAFAAGVKPGAAMAGDLLGAHKF